MSATFEDAVYIEVQFNHLGAIESSKERVTMQWENLTSDDFADAVKSTGGVCVVGAGVLERHATHLPLGTDMIISHAACVRAAERESAVVYPAVWFGQIFEARCFPGTVNLEPKLLFALYEAVFDEIARNGFSKIIVHNGHGGNWHLLKYLAQSTLWQRKPYTLYIQSTWLNPEEDKAWKALRETEYHGHACECETSCMLDVAPHLVHMDRVPNEPALNLKRDAHLPDNFSGSSWYAAHPEHYAGDARTATAEKGAKLMELMVASLTRFITNVKNDTVLPALEQEFYDRCDRVGGQE